MEEGRRFFSSPAQYPKDLSYKPLVEKFKDMVKAESRVVGRKTASEDSAPLPTLASPMIPKPGDRCEKYRLADGGRLTIIHRAGGEINYNLKLRDGRQVILMRREDAISLLVTDAAGNTVKTLASEL